MDITTEITTAVPKMFKSIPQLTFSWYDYTLFTLMLALSALIGIYFGFIDKKQNTTSEYLMGGKKMSVIPIAISLVASHVSGITLLAVPSDVYKYGAGYWLGAFALFALHFITTYVYLPVFFKLQITSTYEYLAKRFDEKTRMLASFLYAMSLLTYLPIVIYIPALALSAATGLSVHVISPVVCGVCIFYTTIGGLKAVVWTDTLQFTVTMGALIAVFILGINKVGGIAEVWKTALEGERLDVFNFDPDPTKRDTFWIVIFGLTFLYTSQTSVHQGCVQKFLAVATFKEAKTAVWLYCLGNIVIKAMSVIIGLIMYANFVGCDPFTTGEVKKHDQLLPYFIMKVADKIPGLSGLFIAGVFSASLSTLSANLNCLSGTIYSDFIKKWTGPNTTEEKASHILKIIVVVAGVVSTSLVYLVEHMGGILQLSISLKGISDGPLLGLFTLGMLFRKSNSKGAFYGSVIALGFMSGLLAISKYYQSMHGVSFDSKPVSTENCTYLFNSTITVLKNTTIFSEESKPFVLFRISFYYYTLIGTVITMLFGLIISYFTEDKNEPPVHKDLLSPVVHFLLPKEEKCVLKKDYYSIEKALQIITSNFEKEKKEPYENGT